jgi:hypothetical protein
MKHAVFRSWPVCALIYDMLRETEMEICTLNLSDSKIFIDA